MAADRQRRDFDRFGDCHSPRRNHHPCLPHWSNGSVRSRSNTAAWPGRVTSAARNLRTDHDCNRGCLANGDSTVALATNRQSAPPLLDLASTFRKSADLLYLSELGTA